MELFKDTVDEVPMIVFANGLDLITIRETDTFQTI